MDLKKIAVRLDDEERLELRYKTLVTVDGRNEWVLRTGRLLDVAEDSNILYVDKDGEPVWVRVDEVVEIISADSALS